MRSKIKFVLIITLLTLLASTAFSFPQITSNVETEFGIYSPYIVNIVPNVQPYTIKPDLSNITNKEKFQLTDNEKKLLAKNGFVASPTKYKQVYDIYNYCQKENIPIFVTTDSMLHVYHILYNYTLRILETRKLCDDLEKLNGVMLKNAIAQYDMATTPLAKTATKKNLAFFAVAGVLNNPSITVPAQVKDIVDAELKLIDAHRNFDPSPIFGYDEDYSQYVPRGHYTRNEKLSRYFKSMMWYGRMMFRITPREGIEKGIEETSQAILIVSLIENSKIGSEPALDAWNRIYQPTAFFVGKSDDLNINEYMEIMERIYGADYANLSPDKLADSTKVLSFIEDAKKYHSPMINSTLVWEGEDIGVVTKGFRFMGQRFIPDSYMFQQLVHDKVTGRMFPKGLDVLAIMGSERAYDILINTYKQNGYPKYTDQIAKMRDAFAKMDDEVWAQNLYWNWLYVLMPLLTEKGAGYPIFMQNEAWLDKDLSTSLGSWAELRHDTILYAKQSYTQKTSLPPTPPLVKGYVEPNPELYARLASLAKLTREGLSAKNLLLTEFGAKFKQLEELLLSLKEISELELTNQPLDRDQYGIIVNIGKTLESITTFPPDVSSEIENQEDEEMAIIADVHTDPNGSAVLEEGVGYPMNIFVGTSVDGELRITQGAIFSYYEFEQPMSNRLTDGEWQNILKVNPPPLPIWTGSFIDLSVNPKPGEFLKVENEMSWRPTEMNVNIESKVIEVGAAIEVKAFIQGNLDSLPIVTLKQGDILLKAEMKGEFGQYSASLDTKGMKSGSAHVKIAGISGEEEITYEADITLVKSSAVESNDEYGLQTGKISKIKTRIYSAYPNPFNPDVWIPYDIENGGNVVVEIYGALGQLVRTLDFGYKMPGRYVDANKAGYWDGRNSYGETVSSGLYFYRLKAGNFVATGKMIAVK
jgi:hypothetical protein